MFRTRYTRAVNIHDAHALWLKDYWVNRKKEEGARHFYIIRPSEHQLWATNSHTIVRTGWKLLQHLPSAMRGELAYLEPGTQGVYSLGDGAYLPDDERRHKIWRAFMDNMKEPTRKLVELRPTAWMYHSTYSPTSNTAEEEVVRAPIMLVGKPKNGLPVFAVVDNHEVYPFLSAQSIGYRDATYKFYTYADAHLGLDPVFVRDTSHQVILPTWNPVDGPGFITSNLAGVIQPIDISRRYNNALTPANIAMLTLLGEQTWDDPYRIATR